MVSGNSVSSAGSPPRRPRDDQPAGTREGVLGDLRNLRDIPKLVWLPSLPLRIGRASGSASDTRRSIIASPATR
jgi:hypothetical protein